MQNHASYRVLSRKISSLLPVSGELIANGHLGIFGKRHLTD
ncbi:MAG: hypothetical protein ACJAXL_000443 [Alphaproteobacteria bacterium]|jgi:hypothetical protein